MTGMFPKFSLKKNGAVFLLVLLAVPAFSQPVLTLNEALKIGLENNLDVRIVKNEALFAKESNTYGNAGFLPNVNLNGGRSYQWNDISQKFSSGLEVNRAGVSTNQTNAGIAATWVLYDGGKMFITKRKQDEAEGLGVMRIQNQILNLSDTISAAYYQMVLAKLDEQITRQDIERTDERLKLATEQFRIGTRSKSDVLQAQIDMNVLRNRQATQLSQIEIRKGSFNQLIGREPEIEFEVESEVTLAQSEDFSTLKAKVLQENLQVKVQKKNLEISQLSVNEIKTRALPQINLNTGYTFGRTNSQAGFALYNQSIGPSVGLSLTMPLFTGVSIKKLVTLANIELETRNLQLKLLESRINLQLWRAVKNLDLYLETIRLETENLKLASENLTISTRRFELAQSTTLEYKEAQIQLSNAQSRLLQARFNAKIAEIQLLRLQGRPPAEFSK
jgi:outer membrane protein